MNKINVLRIVEGTSVDGPGLRTSIYVAGCEHKCPGCHNPQSWAFDAGIPMNVDEILKIVDFNAFPVTLSGGDPLYSTPQLLPLVKALKDRGINLWCYTGFTIENLLSFGSEEQRRFLEYVDVLVEGPFISKLRNTDLRFRGSSNQRIIDMKTTLREGRVVMMDFDEDQFTTLLG
ncbi:MAG: anaerobic ribonucleoside-triphosphate reductase activating protein [Bacteroidales bacterium]|nr:anaerobic ribonucleoside-triphosphate reductase activating protein [Bacteroidales bacterium]